jgi:hypothetical protein
MFLIRILLLAIAVALPVTAWSQTRVDSPQIIFLPFNPSAVPPGAWPPPQFFIPLPFLQMPVQVNPGSMPAAATQAIPFPTPFWLWPVPQGLTAPVEEKPRPSVSASPLAPNAAEVAATPATPNPGEPAATSRDAEIRTEPLPASPSATALPPISATDGNTAQDASPPAHSVAGAAGAEQDSPREPDIAASPGTATPKIEPDANAGTPAIRPISKSRKPLAKQKSSSKNRPANKKPVSGKPRKLCWKDGQLDVCP